MTNPNFLVEDDKSNYVVRLGSNIPENLVSRSNEVIASKAASRCGISPNVMYHNLGILILEFIESKTLTDTDIKKDIINIIPLIKEIHNEIPKNIYGQSLIFGFFM